MFLKSSILGLPSFLQCLGFASNLFSAHFLFFCSKKGIQFLLMRLSTVVLITFSLKSSIMTIISVYAQTYAPTTGLIVLIGDQHFPLDPSVRYPGKKVGLTSVYLYFPFLFYTISDSEINFYVDLKQKYAKIDWKAFHLKLFFSFRWRRCELQTNFKRWCWKTDVSHHTWRCFVKILVSWFAVWLSFLNFINVWLHFHQVNHVLVGISTTSKRLVNSIYRRKIDSSLLWSFIISTN